MKCSIVLTRVAVTLMIDGLQNGPPIEHDRTNLQYMFSYYKRDVSCDLTFW